MVYQEIGETRNALGKDLSDKLYKVVEEVRVEQPTLKHYFVIYSAKFDKFLTNIIREGFTVVSPNRIKNIPPMLGAICWEIDEMAGKIETLYCLPFDHKASYSELVSDEMGGIILK